jgi:hypothetical protein
LLNDLSPKSGFPDGVERFVSAGWGGNLPRLCTSASPSRPLIPNPSTSPNAVWDPETHFRWEGLLAPGISSGGGDGTSPRGRQFDRGRL